MVNFSAKTSIPFHTLKLKACMRAEVSVIVISALWIGHIISVPGKGKDFSFFP
jgi:hypothetical protein